MLFKQFILEGTIKMHSRMNPDFHRDLKPMRHPRTNSFLILAPRKGSLPS